jgi:hypothetical protein
VGSTLFWKVHLSACMIGHPVRNKPGQPCSQPPGSAYVQVRGTLHTVAPHACSYSCAVAIG